MRSVSSPHAPLAAFYVTAAAGGCMLAFDSPVRRTFVREMVPLADVANAVTLNTAMLNVARIVGPTIAGVLIGSVGYGWCFALDGVTYIAILTTLAMMRTAELRRVAGTPRGPGQIGAGFEYIAGVPELWITFVMLLIIGTISYNFTVVFPLFVIQGLGGTEGTYTCVYAAFGVGALIGAVGVARRTAFTVCYPSVLHRTRSPRSELEP